MVIAKKQIVVAGRVVSGLSDQAPDARLSGIDFYLE